MASGALEGSGHESAGPRRRGPADGYSGWWWGVYMLIPVPAEGTAAAGPVSCWVV